MAFDRSGATIFVTLDISKTFDRIWDAGLLHKFKSYIILCRIFGLNSCFLSNGFEWLWMGSLSKKIQLMLQFARSPFVLQFSYYALVPNLMMVSVIFLPMLMILSTRSVIRHLIFGDN